MNFLYGGKLAFPLPKYMLNVSGRNDNHEIVPHRHQRGIWIRTALSTPDVGKT